MIRKLLLVALSFSLALLSCGRQDDGVVRRPEEPDVDTEFDEYLMKRAIAEAKSTLDVFVSALQERKSGTSHFAIKKGFRYGTDGREYIWITNVRTIGGEFEGEINNRPVDTTEVKLGQRVRVHRADVADWMYQDQGQLRGGYTIVALVYGTPDQTRYEKAMKIDWSQYRFLQQRK